MKKRKKKKTLLFDEKNCRNFFAIDAFFYFTRKKVGKKW